MKILHYLPLVFCLFCFELTFPQNDSASIKGETLTHYSHRDSVYLDKLNTNSNLMLAGGVGLCGAGTYLIYAGAKLYKTPAPPNSSDPSNDVQRNHTQGGAYIAGGVIGIGAGAVLLVFGAKGKLEYNRRIKKMQLQSGLLQDGHVGAMLGF
jgi:hypothetical protein